MKEHSVDSADYAAVIRVESFGTGQVRLVDSPLRSGGCVVRVLCASVGSTDVQAHRGDYLLHPVPGFVSGYDFVGVLTRVDREGACRGLVSGQRVTGVLPGMGAHASQVRVPASLLVPVPESLAAEVVATLPLDGVTARLAIDLLGSGVRSVFISGVTGGVGVLAAQLALSRGARVVGTASPTSSWVAERFGVRVVDYGRPDWREQVRADVGAVDGMIDHTGTRGLGGFVRPGGRVVRTAFGGEPGGQRLTTAVGATRSLLRRFARPSEVVCSAPLHVRMHRAQYRRELRDILDGVAGGHLVPLAPDVYRTDELGRAFRAAAQPTPGTKVVLRFG